MSSLETKIKLEDKKGFYGTPFSFGISKNLPELIHKRLIIITHVLDILLPVFEIGYYCVGKK